MVVFHTTSEPPRLKAEMFKCVTSVHGVTACQQSANVIAFPFYGFWRENVWHKKNTMFLIPGY